MKLLSFNIEYVMIVLFPINLGVSIFANNHILFLLTYYKVPRILWKMGFSIHLAKKIMLSSAIVLQ